MTNRYKIFFILISIFLSALFSNNFVSKFRVPIQTTTSVSFGYDSNIFRLSKSDMNADFDFSNPIIVANSFDSGYLTPKISVSYRPQLLKKNITEFNFSFLRNNYFTSKEKSYNIYFSEFGLRLGPYQWIRFSHRLIPKYYLRNYIDHDFSIDENFECYFSSESVQGSYSHRLINKNWVKIKISQTNLYYNQYFTEFNTEILQADVKFYFDILKFSNNLYVAISNGDNISFNSGYGTTVFDRSYDEYAFGVTSKKKIKSPFLDLFGFSSLIKNRLYNSESDGDPLHNGRAHIEYNFSAWLNKEINNKVDLQIKLKYRLRDVESDFIWVSELKEFNKYEIILKVSYDKSLDILY